MTLKIITVEELTATLNIDEVPALLRVAATCIEQGRLDSACWRMADASLLLQRRLKREGWVDVVGLNTPTGLGAVIGGRPAP